MKAVICTKFGGLDGISVGEFPPPVMGDHDVLIQVGSASVSYMDWLMIQGRYQMKPDLPYVPGTDAAGVVVSVGREVRRIKPGDRVACSSWYGAFAEFMTVAEDKCCIIPDNVSFISASTVIYAYGTAYYALVEKSKLQRNETLLVTGAGGGVGLAAVEMGAFLGATVVAVVGSDEKAKIAREYGANFVINYRSQDLRQCIRDITDAKGIDVCVECVGGDLFEPIARSMAWDGRLMPIGFASGTIPNLPMNLPLIKNFSVVGAGAGKWWELFPTDAMKAHETVFSWVGQGYIHPRIDQVMSLDQAVEALTILESRKVIGRIALSISDSVE